MIGSLNRESALALLQDNTYGRIGCNDGYNTYVYPTNYFFDGKYIYCHALPGSRINVMRRNKRVCFQVELLKDEMNWESIMVMGDFEELDEGRDRYYAMKSFVDRTMHLKISEGLGMPEVTQAWLHLRLPDNLKPVIYRISVDEIVGRYEME